ncbi:glucosamine-6-phosphate deaminase [Kribbella hippodromi]|uniref:Glucosamine-6-phosphate deaminase n=1 Tax=Kribbella hippodromi TaxID=434347 RepID=A0ABP4NIB1_9ACTN
MTISDSTFAVGELTVEVHPSEQAAGSAAADFAAATIGAAVRDRGAARVVVATGNSQLAFVHALAGVDIPWDRVTVFHMDEYLGLDADHPASFRRWIRENVGISFSPARVEYIQPDRGDPEAECGRYEALLREAPLDLTCMGVGENGHLAFNEPGAADFADERWARVIELTPESRRQQVNEGHFPDPQSVPPAAISLTIPALLSSRTVQVVVPELRKAPAIARALNGPVDNSCPASILQRHGHARLFLDQQSSSQVAWPATT